MVDIMINIKLISSCIFIHFTLNVLTFLLCLNLSVLLIFDYISMDNKLLNHKHRLTEHDIVKLFSVSSAIFVLNMLKAHTTNCTTVHRYPIFSTRYLVMCKV